MTTSTKTSTAVSHIAAAYTDWTNPTNAQGASDDTYATAALGTSSTAKYSDFLKAVDFDFEIPSTATINGVSVTIQGKASATSSVDIYGVYLVINDTIQDTRRYDTTKWTASDADYTLGGSTDIWGETLTPAIINDATFGVVIKLMNSNASSRTAYIDSITITVDYTVSSVDLELSISVDNNSPYENEYIDVSVELENTSSVISPGTTVTLDIDAGFTLAHSSCSFGSYDDTTGVWTIGTANPTTTYIMHLIFQIETAGLYNIHGIMDSDLDIIDEDNLVSLNVETGTDSGENTTGFLETNGATIASSTAQAYEGTHSLKVTTDTQEFSGVSIESITTEYATKYGVSLLIYAPESEEIAIYAANDSWELIDESETYTGTGDWLYITLTFTNPDDTSKASKLIINNLDNDDNSFDFYIDKIKFYEGSIPTGDPADLNVNCYARATPDTYGFTYKNQHSTDFDITFIDYPERNTHPPTNDVLTSVAGRDGQFPLRQDDQATKISIKFIVYADTEEDLREKLYEIGQWLSTEKIRNNVPVMNELIFDDETDKKWLGYFVDEVKVKSSYTSAELTATYQVPGGLAQSVYTHISSAVGTNNGSVSVPCKIYITADDQSDMIVTNTQTSQSVSITRDFTFGEGVVIDTDKRLITAGGRDIRNCVNFNSTFFKLNPGAFTIQTTNGTIYRVEFDEKYY